MLDLVESESQAGNPPHKRAEYYTTAGLFSAEVGELEKAAEMFWKAYRVELKREEYHPRMADALSGLTQVRMKQSKLRNARVCIRRLLQLAKHRWPERVLDAEVALRMVRCRIAFQAWKENMKKGKAVSENFTTVICLS
ncbi:PREDICTED: uncharacterized protein LOC109462013 [Branchiostoma belcheri]|uniref:Uncharacterized protein LOC109462013 n=1 Tax=Branchiostoma belcheri TaxID=7741 RepID=A0A6P4XPQ2_BRABE|nr:PREDICTED: uncharacterized protein LOC109462013 [Branchiostoma belcheri]